MKAIVCSLDGDLYFFDIVTWVFQGDTLTLFLSIIYLETQFLPGSGCVDTAIWMHYMDTN